MSPEVAALRQGLGTFWVVFAVGSVSADWDLIPGVSRIVRALARRGKEVTGGRVTRFQGYPTFSSAFQSPLLQPTPPALPPPPNLLRTSSAS